jgi:hypothetical protein
LPFWRKNYVRTLVVIDPGPACAVPNACPCAAPTLMGFAMSSTHLRAGCPAFAGHDVFLCCYGVRHTNNLVIRGLDPRIHRSSDESFARRWMAGSSPAKTSGLLLPDGQISDLAVQPHLQKYFASPVGQIISTNSRHPTPPEGRIAIVTDVGVRMRWTRQHFARDGIAGQVEKTCERSPAR